MENESYSEYSAYINEYQTVGSDIDYEVEDPEIAHFNFITDGVLLCVVCLFGLLGNIFTLFVLCRQEMKSTVNHYLKHLAVYDMLFLICKIFMHVIYEFSLHNTVIMKIYTALYPGFMYFVGVLLHIVRMGSIWTTVGVSIERYIAVCHPLKAVSFCNYKRAVQVNIIIALSVICYNIPRFFLYEFVPAVDNYSNETTTELDYTDFGKSEIFGVYETWINSIVNSVIPILSLLYLNISIYLIVRKARKVRQEMTQKQDTDMKLAMMLFCIVVIFVICYTPSLIFGIVLNAGLEDKWFRSRVRPMMHLTEAVNSSVNFIVYSVMCLHFRIVVFQIFCGRHLERGQAIRK